MKLAAIYSNYEEIFPRIVFKDGINVIFGQVKEENLRKDSHNLGKTFLITVIDFCLLSGINRSHPFKSNPDLFESFEFYLEIETNEGRYITIKRKVKSNTKISIHTTHGERGAILSSLPDSDWSHANLSLEKAKDLLNNLLNLTDIAPYPYRKGLSHVMRRQSDYIDEFRTSKFSISKDSFWKPYILKILGFDDSYLNNKYNTDSLIEKSKSALRIYESDAGHKNEEYDELKGREEILQERLLVLRSRVDGFDFREIDEVVSGEMVSSVEKEISSLNEVKYRADASIRDIRESMSNAFSFDLRRIEKLFEEVEIAFEGSLKKSYEDLINFNKRLSISRNKHLEEQLILEENKKEIAAEKIRLLTLRRQELVSLLLESETLEKYKEAQKQLLEKEKELIELRTMLENLDKAGEAGKELAGLQRERITEIDEVTTEIRKGNPVYSSIRRKFSNLAEDILDTSAILRMQVNNEGNPDFAVVTMNESRETNEGSGTSYKKILCACFDLAVASAHSSGSYYRYIYHDGIFEGLDNRKKLRLLKNVRNICESDSIQYILTVIDTDLPRDSSDNKLLFSEDEIVRRLDDTGNEGRLFKMQRF